MLCVSRVLLSGRGHRGILEPNEPNGFSTGTPSGGFVWAPSCTRACRACASPSACRRPTCVHTLGVGWKALAETGGVACYMTIPCTRSHFWRSHFGSRFLLAHHRPCLTPPSVEQFPGRVPSLAYIIVWSRVRDQSPCMAYVFFSSLD